MDVFEVYELMTKDHLDLNKISLLQKLLGDLEPLKESELHRHAKHLGQREAQLAEKIAQNILEKLVITLVANMVKSEVSLHQEILQGLFEKECSAEDTMGLAKCA
jgi:hypothetical protein